MEVACEALAESFPSLPLCRKVELVECKPQTAAERHGLSSALTPHEASRVSTLSRTPMTHVLFMFSFPTTRLSSEEMLPRS